MSGWVGREKRVSDMSRDKEGRIRKRIRRRVEQGEGGGVGEGRREEEGGQG